MQLPHRKPLPEFQLPRIQRRYRFSLTPLADTMFQLLIFFMLSANTIPYSMLSVQAGALANMGQGPDLTDGTATTGLQGSDPMMTAVWSVRADSIIANGQRFPLERIPDLAQALQAQNTPEVLLISQPEADVQMLVSILEILAESEIGVVRIADGTRP